MLDPTVLRPSAGHDFRRLGLILLRKSAVVAVCVLLALVISVGAYGSKTISRADDVNACPAVQAVTDDFSGPAGAPPKQQLWSYQLGAGGSDGQLEAFTDSPRNASLDGNGNLAIVALNEPIDFPGAGVFNYTSSFLNTHGHLDVCYGTVSARIKLPTGHGLRPAFWLSGSDFSTVGWPQCGEIDIFDSGLPKVVTSIHGPAGYDCRLTCRSMGARVGMNTPCLGDATGSRQALTEKCWPPGHRSCCRPIHRGCSTIIRCI